jgi:hypothetical protein
LLLGAHRVFDGALFAFFIALREAFFACGALVFFGALMVLAFPCFLIGLLGMPLCGAALTFFAAAKKVSKESGLPTASL